MAQKIILPSLILAFLPAFLHAQVDSLSAKDSLAAEASAVPTSVGRIKVKFPWTVQSFDKTEIARFPFRGIENYLPLFPGVVSVNNELHLRGSRSNEAGYFIDGVDVTNPLYGSNGVPLIPEAMEALEVHTGPYSATMGSYNGGIVMSRMKKGGDRLSVSVDIQSDKFHSPGQQFLKTTVQGYENVVGTIGGPLPWLGIRFFLTGQRTTYVNRQAMFLEPFRYENLVDDGGWTSSDQGKPLPGPVEFKRNFLPGNRSERSTFQGNGSVELYGISLSAMGSYDEYEYTVGSEWPLALTNYFNQSRNMVSRTKTRLGTGRASYSLGDLLEATLTFSFYDRYSRLFDPIFKNNWLAYADSAANAQYFDTSRWRSQYDGPYPYSTISYFAFTSAGAPNNEYSKNRQSSTQWAVDFVSHPSTFLELRAGGNLTAWTMRSFSVTNISHLLYSQQYGQPFANPYEQRLRYLLSGVSNYGYTFTGVQSDGATLAGGPNTALDSPYRPTFASAYLDGLLTTNDLLIQAGIRYESFNPKFKTFGFPLRTASLADFGYDLYIADESKIQSTSSISVLLPRISLKVTPSAQTVLFAGYGLFAQMPALDPLYYSSYSFLQRVTPWDRSPYGGEVSFEVRPERSRQFEVGIQQQVNSMVTVHGGFHYKVLSNQLQVARYYDQSGEPLFTQYRNDGKGIIKGLEIGFDMMASPTFSAHMSYEYSTAQGLSSNPRSNRVLFSDEMFPPTPFTFRPLDHEQLHRATAIMQARTGDDQGVLLRGIEATAILTVRSGHPYTKETEIQNLGCCSSWYIGVLTISDPRFARPVEAHNSSTTPFTMNLDLRISKTFDIQVGTAKVFLDVLNVLNTKNKLNVYPTTGTTNDDSWLGSPLSQYTRQQPLFEEFYRDINLNNRWAYMNVTGYDMFGTPRRIQFGLNIMLGGTQ